MKSVDQPCSLFIWYRGHPDLLPGLREWIHCLEKASGYGGLLYLREDATETTYMEVFHHVGSAGLEEIEMHAAKQACFYNIKRHCELFTPDRP